MFKIVLFITLAFLNKNTLANNADLSENTVNSGNFVLNEKSLNDLLDKNNPTLEKINMIYESAKLDEAKFNENFSYNLSGNVYFMDSNDKGNPAYDTQVSTGVKKVGVDLNKNFIYGMGGTVSFYTGEYSMMMPLNGLYDFNYGKSGLKLTYSMDLWKNFLGYQTATKNLNIQLNKKQSEIKQKIEINNYKSSSVNLYWQMYTKKQEIILYEAMVKQAEKMLENIKKMHKSYLVDKRDIAKAEANLESKKYNLNNAKLEMSNLKKEFRKLFPELLEKNIILEDVNVYNYLDKVNMCNNVIGNSSSWKNYTSYSDYIDFMDKIFETEEKMLSRYSDVDVKLKLEADIRGTDKNIGSSLKDFKEFNRNDYNVALVVSKALDNTDGEVKMQQLKMSKMNYNVNKNSTIANISSFYNSYINVMKNLFLMQENIRNTKKNMEIRVVGSTDKFNKGRISLNDLLIDQDSLIQANVNLIKINTNIIMIAMQYLSIFDKFNCELIIKKI